jgi:D-glycero-alpha-D-manno-heptose-7-phosphate kinase
MGEIGGLLKSGWQLKRGMMQETNSLDPLNNLFEKAQKLGSHGGKLMGAGGSGFFYLLVDRENQQKVRDEFQEIKFWTNIQFDKDGATTWNLSEGGNRE